MTTGGKYIVINFTYNSFIFNAWDDAWNILTLSNFIKSEYNDDIDEDSDDDDSDDDDSDDDENDDENRMIFFNILLLVWFSFLIFLNLAFEIIFILIFSKTKRW